MRFKKHDKIINHVNGNHVFAIVQKILKDGSLLVRNERIGKWVADPDKCQLFNEPHNF